MGLGKQVQKHSVAAVAFNLDEEKTSLVCPIGVCDSKREKMTLPAPVRKRSLRAQGSSGKGRSQEHKMSEENLGNVKM